jgi:hypothetical protein
MFEPNAVTSDQCFWLIFALTNVNSTNKVVVILEHLQPCPMFAVNSFSNYPIILNV